MTEPTKLTRDAIIDTAIAMADAEGLDALSMRRIAERMGVGAMSLYRHIANKDELVAAMADEVATRYPYPRPVPADWTWRHRVQIAGEIDWTLYQYHPWVLLAFTVPRYSFGPGSLDGLAWLVEGFRELEVSTHEATLMSLAVWNYISGATLPHISAALLPHKEPDAADQNGLRTLLEGNPCYPTPPILMELCGTGSEFDQVDMLRIGLTALCDGFAQRAEHLRRREAGPATP
ncbi:TetR/AcrR family transcriptional regulator [Nocardia donostiensis]|uniref:TetR family transcriptional regulator n=1 Tax=Nocardia donostiensis TaxID=1538463 RepID=A0A1W0AZ28_9NOCA|nr:TetR/AcrR family transcriptional regulator [Nocardia donostiensis]ONM48863.1 TetR family transcriptional regulator [Nocardia donostiensis]OQS15515.1 TetR family transcriptional regulator [Nocardia donostiensis]OQS22881.1 TetR family transcriptional regulator [Nocardia donostiensis]